MTPLSATRKSIISIPNSSIDLNYPCSAQSRIDTSKGFSHLLDGITLEEVLGQSGLHDDEVELFRKVLVDGHFPFEEYESKAKTFLALWLFQHKQAKLLAQWLEILPLSLHVSTKEIAAGLLALMQSPLSFSGLTVNLVAPFRNDFSNEVIPLLEQAFQANASLTKITIVGRNDGTIDLSPLLDVLAGVAGLELAIHGGAMTPADCECLGTLLSRNRTVRVLVLRNLCSVPGDDGSEASGAGSVAGAIKHLAGQLQLESLELGNVPPQCQAVIGKLMSTSHVLKWLKIALDGKMIDPDLIDGFRQTSSVEHVYLSVGELESGICSLIASIANRNTSIKSLELDSSHSRAGRNYSPGICLLISGNRNLAYLVWRLPAGCHVDLAQVGMALKKNNRLETLMLIEHAEADEGNWPGWVNDTSVSALAMNLKKNYTLTELVLDLEGERRSGSRRSCSVLQQVMDRNRAIQVYACSHGFLFGAVEGFLATIDLPVDIAWNTTKTLAHYTPRTGVAALALVNKASYGAALFRRRETQSIFIDSLLPPPRGLVMHRRTRMIELLNGVIACKGGFSDNDMLRMVDNEMLPGALMAIMLRSPDDYLYLVRGFCQAVGMEKIRSSITNEIAENDIRDASEPEGTGKAFVLSMLEQSFPPDQKHLAPFFEKTLNYDAINSATAKLFVGYNIPIVRSVGADCEEIVSWCMENRQPAVLMAFYDATAYTVVINFTAYSGPFARNMMEKIPQLKRAHTVCLEGVPDYEDAVVLARVLGEPSNLAELHIDGNCCGQEFEFIMQGLSVNTSIRGLSVSLRKMPNPPAICETLASLLDANRTIEYVCLQVDDNDPEQPQLRQLAAINSRFELEFDSGDDSD